MPTKTIVTLNDLLATFMEQMYDRHDRIERHLDSLSQKVDQVMATLDDLKNNQSKERALIEKLLGLLASAAPGSFTPAQQQEIDSIAADQATALGEDTTGGTTPAA